MAKSARKQKRSSSVLQLRLRGALDKAHRAASDSFAAHLLGMYYSVCSSLKSYHLSQPPEKKSNTSKPFVSPRDRLARLLLNGRVNGFVKKQAEKVPFVSTRAFGFLVCSFGVYTAVVYLVKEYAFSVQKADISTLYAGAACFLVSLFFMSKRPVIATAKKSALLSFIVFELFGVQEPENIPEKALYGSESVAFLIGMTAGLLTFVIPLPYYLAAIICVPVLYTVLRRPEAGVILMIITLPFVPLYFSLILCGATLGAYILKLICKRRSFSASPLDLGVLLFLGLTACGNIGSADGGEPLQYALLITGYFLCRNLLNTRRILLRAMSAVAAVGTTVAACAVFTYLFGSDAFEFNGYNVFSGIHIGADVFFGSSAALSSYLILTAPFLLYIYGFFDKKDDVKGKSGKKKDNKPKTLLLFALAVVCAAIFATYNTGAWASIFLAAAAVALCNKRRFSAWLPVLLPVAGVAVSFLPPTVWNFISQNIHASDAGIRYKLSVMSGASKLAADNFLGGTGFSGFGFLYPQYAEKGCEAAANSYNIYLQILSVLGITGLFVFLLVMLLYFSMNYSYLTSSLSTETRSCVYAPLTAVAAVLIQGFTNCIIDDGRVFLLLFIVLGIGAAACEIGRGETEYKLGSTYGFAMYRAYSVQYTGKGTPKGKETDNEEK